MQLLIEVLVVNGQVEVNAFLVDGTPLALNEGIVIGPAAPVATNLAASSQQGLLKELADKLAALVGIVEGAGGKFWFQAAELRQLLVGDHFAARTGGRRKIGGRIRHRVNFSCRR